MMPVFRIKLPWQTVEELATTTINGVSIGVHAYVSDGKLSVP